MSLPVFLAEDPASGRLSGPEGRHAVTVKRITPGERIILADGSGTGVIIEVVSVSGKDQLQGRVLETVREDTPRPRITVVQALPKSDRSELAVDLATQAGADAIIPWQAARCEAKWVGPKVAKQVAKWEATAASASKQSRRLSVPAISAPMSTKQLAAHIAGAPAYVLHEDAEVSVRDIDLDVDELYLLIGPEGGIGDEELALLGVPTVALGPQVYRTASAAMVALAAIGALQRW